MKNTTTQTIELSESDLSAAVNDWLRKRFSGGSWNVETKAVVVSRGYGPMEHDETEVVISATRET